MLGTSKAQKGEASLAGQAWASCSQSRHQRWENTLRMWPVESGFWNLALWGALGMGSFSGSLFHWLCLEPELNMAQLFKSMSFKSVIILISLV